MSQRITLQRVRISYPTLFNPKAVEAGQEPRYSAAFLLPQNDPVVATINQAAQAAINEMFGSAPPAQLKPLPMYAGETKYPGDSNYAGLYVIQAYAATKPYVVDENVQKVIDPSRIYAGCYVNASLAIYAYKRNTGSGLAFGLDGVQFVGDGERLDGRPAVGDLFQPVAGAPAPIGQAPGVMPVQQPAGAPQQAPMPAVPGQGPLPPNGYNF